MLVPNSLLMAVTPSTFVPGALVKPTIGVWAVNPGTPGTVGAGARAGLAGDNCEGAVGGGANTPGGVLGGLLDFCAFRLMVRKTVKMQIACFIFSTSFSAAAGIISIERGLLFCQYNLKCRGKGALWGLVPA